MEITTSSALETQDLAKDISKKLSPGDILALSGDLGSGKTTFVQGLANAFGIKKPVTSPTFVIMKAYETSDSPIKRMFHLDSYRLESKEDAESIGLSDLLEQEQGIVVIEWPEKIKGQLPARTKTITFKYLEDDKRMIASNDF